MLSSTLARRLNPTQILLNFTARSLSTKPTSYLPSATPESQLNLQNFDPSTVIEALSCYSNDWKRALDFFNWVETECEFKHTTDTYNRMIDILGKFFEFDLSWDLIQRMRTVPCSMPNHVTFRILFKRYISAHLVTEAINTFDRLEEFNLKDGTSYCNLIDALCEFKHVIEAQELCFRKNMEENNAIDARNKTKIYNMILRGWFKMEWWSKCWEFWEEMDRKGVYKDLYSHSIYMDILCKSGKPWKAVKLYKEMKTKGIKLDVVAYNTVIRAVGLSQGVDFATRVYREMIELGCMPNVVTCNTVIKLLCQNGRTMEAYKMLDEMRKKDIVPDVITYHCFFRCLVKPKEILWLFDRMIESGVWPRMDTYVMLMRKFGRWGFLRPVFVVWKKMEEHACSPDEFAYNALIDALIQKGMLDMARKYEQEMLSKGLSPKPREDLSTKDVEGG
ncbi:hypothetical protein P3X46_010811 [Hevea brasiliensis]|uniref:Pentacotripeptide-repeat region of PRORP domain-containing protein n=1 Tax=Hevea brasiliensis TaxID=3981 RepID=A0ABQ9MJ32_HEVBR|nr:pentatricopeptide repeat-containing protein At1g80550, mitochondrial [Hevea brasiliensis]KAJ9178975.1 hypothetical protein P3X46_010811 [Hevea brasiliensis]